MAELRRGSSALNDLNALLDDERSRRAKKVMRHYLVQFLKSEGRTCEEFIGLGIDEIEWTRPRFAYAVDPTGRNRVQSGAPIQLR